MVNNITVWHELKARCAARDERVATAPENGDSPHPHPHPHPPLLSARASSLLSLRSSGVPLSSEASPSPPRPPFLGGWCARRSSGYEYDPELGCGSSEAVVGCAAALGPCRRAGRLGITPGRGRRRPHRRWRDRRESYYIRCSPPVLLQQHRRGSLDVCLATLRPGG